MNTKPAHYESKMLLHRAGNLGRRISAPKFLNILFSKTWREKREELEYLQN